VWNAVSASRSVPRASPSGNSSRRPTRFLRKISFNKVRLSAAFGWHYKETCRFRAAQMRRSEPWEGTVGGLNRANGSRGPLGPKHNRFAPTRWIVCEVHINLPSLLIMHLRYFCYIISQQGQALGMNPASESRAVRYMFSIFPRNLKFRHRPSDAAGSFNLLLPQRL
jgi:hypothetical protein